MSSPKKKTLVCTVRNQSGRVANKQIRSQEEARVPAILYGEKQPNILLSTAQHNVDLLNQRHQLSGHLFELQIGSKKEIALVKSIQKHHLKNNITHIDFQRVSKTHKLHTNIPVLFKNVEDSPAAKKNGQVTYALTEVSIECLPKDLPEHITLDLSKLEIDQIIHVADLTLPKGVILIAPTDIAHNPTVVTAHLSKGEKGSEESVSVQEPVTLE